jgi:hypothetical protein
VRAVGGSRIPAEAMDIYLKQKCGHLEQQEQDEFFNFLRRQIGRTLTAETVAMIVAREIASPRDLRRVVVEAYKTVILDGKRN